MVTRHQTNWLITLVRQCLNAKKDITCTWIKTKPNVIIAILRDISTFYINYLTMYCVHMHAGAIIKLLYGCVYIREIIHEFHLKLVDYLPVQTHKLCNNLHLAYCVICVSPREKKHLIFVAYKQHLRRQPFYIFVRNLRIEIYFIIWRRVWEWNNAMQ